jgi:CheY-like chemotaxis protein
VELHNGTVEAHSEGLGRGSEFVVRLPTLLQLGEEHHNGSSNNGDATLAPRPDRLRAVVVDDNVDAAESLADLLRLLGHEVAIAHDGPTGLAAARSFRPDLVLLDIGLPGMDGYEVARRLQSDSDSSAVIVAVSGYGRDEDRRLSREAGMKHHFVKPIEFRALRALLESVCGERKSAIPTPS